jgi:hypothetical protein
MRPIMFAAEDIDRLCFLRGTEGIVIGLARAAQLRPSRHGYRLLISRSRRWITSARTVSGTGWSGVNRIVPLARSKPSRRSLWGTSDGDGTQVWFELALP